VKAAILGHGRAVAAFVIRDFSLLRRYAAWESVWIVYTVVSILTIGFIGVDQGDDELVVFLMVGGLLWGFLSTLFHTLAESVAWEMWEGTIEYTFMAPISRSAFLVGSCAFAVLYGLIRTVAVLAAVILLFGVSLANANVTSAVVILVASSLSFVGLGLVAAVLPMFSPERGSQTAHILQALVLLVSGVYYDVEVLPGWLQPFSKVSPATYTLRAMRGALIDGRGLGDMRGTLVLLFVFAVVLIPLGYAAFTWGETHARRAGKLKRSG
jgi:ABC-2 type transport system permease protein